VAGHSPRVVIASADASLRTGLRMTLAAAGLSIAAEVASAPEAVSTVVAESPELVLISAEVPGDAFGAVREISTRLPATRIVVPTRARTARSS
jgi:DNA-binding NarL/FixJ family response regulator